MADPISTALTITKQLLDVAVVAKNAQAKLLVAELQIQLAEAKTRIAEMMEETLALREQLRVAAEKPVLEIRDGLYYTSDGDGPFCTSCYDSGGKVIRLTEMVHTFRSFGKYRCNVCEGHYKG